MMTTSLNALDVALAGECPMDDSVPSSVLRRRRTTLVPTWSRVSYALEVLAIDLEILKSDLDHPGVTRALLRRLNLQRSVLMEQKRGLEEEVKEVHDVLLSRYAAGSASVDDWLD
jgi:hypothetical protein